MDVDTEDKQINTYIACQMIINVNGYGKKDKKVKGSAVGGGEDYIILKTDQQRIIK